VISSDGKFNVSTANQSYHERVVDIFDSYSSTWYLNLLQHSAGDGEMVAGVGYMLVILGGESPTNTDIFSKEIATVNVFEWVPNNYSLLACSDITDCETCLYNTLQNNVRVRACVRACGRACVRVGVTVRRVGSVSLVLGHDGTVHRSGERRRLPAPGRV
jgi:hypothetical protein